mmetsp:Transcript_37828/g.74787  ORF Transcript_37828/g.74787 Transcript_37828/m.74787 type:complete len:210 (+) Transcript_37828:408-1037(+)
MPILGTFGELLALVTEGFEAGQNGAQQHVVATLGAVPCCGATPSDPLPLSSEPSGSGLSSFSSSSSRLSTLAVSKTTASSSTSLSSCCFSSPSSSPSSLPPPPPSSSSSSPSPSSSLSSLSTSKARRERNLAGYEAVASAWSSLLLAIEAHVSMDRPMFAAVVVVMRFCKTVFLEKMTARPRSARKVGLPLGPTRSWTCHVICIVKKVE